jgi:hypothetical protein
VAGEVAEKREAGVGEVRDPVEVKVYAGAEVSTASIAKGVESFGIEDARGDEKDPVRG